MFKIYTHLIAFLFLFCSCTLDCKFLKYTDGVTYFNGIKYSGDCISYFSDGKISSKQSYKDGLDNGSWEFYHTNGQIQTKGNYYFGLRNGTWVYYYDNGALEQISHYKLGLKDSIWENYLINHDLNWEKSFKNDSLISIINYQRIN